MKITTLILSLLLATSFGFGCKGNTDDTKADDTEAAKPVDPNAPSGGAEPDDTAADEADQAEDMAGEAVDETEEAADEAADETGEAADEAGDELDEATGDEPAAGEEG